jgi:hypothetical protein
VITDTLTSLQYSLLGTHSDHGYSHITSVLTDRQRNLVQCCVAACIVLTHAARCVDIEAVSVFSWCLSVVEDCNNKRRGLDVLHTSAIRVHPVQRRGIPVFVKQPDKGLHPLQVGHVSCCDRLHCKSKFRSCLKAGCLLKPDVHTHISSKFNVQSKR